MNAQKLSVLLLSAILLFVIATLFLIPDGFFGIPAAVGYAFCHQQPARSLQMSGYEAAFCYRCTGLFIGILFGVLWQLPGRKFAKAYSKKTLLFAFLAAMFFVIDSLNSSFVLTMLGIQPFYADNPLLRTVSGFGMGSACALIIFPIFIRLYTANPDTTMSPLKATWQKIGLLLSLSLLLGMMTVKKSVIGIFLNWLTAASAILALSILYGSLLLATGTNFDQRRKIWTKKNKLLAGILLALFEISAVSYFRFQLTGSWGWPL